MVVQHLRVAEVRELRKHELRFFAAAYDDVDKFQRVWTHLADVVAVNTQQNVFYFIRYFVDILAELDYILAFDWGYKSVREDVHQFVFLFVSAVFGLVYLGKTRFQVIRVEILQRVVQYVRRATCKVRAAGEVLKIERVMLPAHVCFLSFSGIYRTAIKSFAIA